MRAQRFPGTLVDVVDARTIELEKPMLYREQVRRNRERQGHQTPPRMSRATFWEVWDAKPRLVSPGERRRRDTLMGGVGLRRRSARQR